jgi:5-methylcytosine-specific restriction endonuclease McrA
MFVQVPEDYGDLSRAVPGTPLLALMRYGHDVGYLLHLHMQIVLYCKQQHITEPVHEAVFSVCGYPRRPRTTSRDIKRLAAAGFLEATGDNTYRVPAAAEWVAVRIGTRDPIPDRVRVSVYERDGWRCVECGSADDLTVDHIIPWSLNGPDKEENLRTLCGPCNSKKGARC